MVNYHVMCRASSRNSGRLDSHFALQEVDDDGRETFRGPIVEYETEEAAQAVADRLTADEPENSRYSYYIKEVPD